VQGPLYKEFPTSKFDRAAPAVSAFFCRFAGLTQLSATLPSVSSTLKCTQLGREQDCQALTQTFPCFGDSRGASLVWYCQDIFKWKEIATQFPETEVCCKQFDSFH
jgi:hypothetical protein